MDKENKLKILNIFYENNKRNVIENSVPKFSESRSFIEDTLFYVIEKIIYHFGQEKLDFLIEKSTKNLRVIEPSSDRYYSSLLDILFNNLIKKILIEGNSEFKSIDFDRINFVQFDFSEEQVCELYYPNIVIIKIQHPENLFRWCRFDGISSFPKKFKKLQEEGDYLAIKDLIESQEKYFKLFNQIVDFVKNIFEDSSYMKDRIDGKNLIQIQKA